MNQILGEIRIWAAGGIPQGFAPCDGSLMDIAGNEGLFQILGTTYGGDGVATFALPDLRGRTVIGAGQGTGLTARTLGSNGGLEEVTLTAGQMPAHSHGIGAGAELRVGDESSTVVDTASDNYLGNAPGAYRDLQGAGALKGLGGTTGMTGSGDAFDNMPPFLVLNFVIATKGIFPRLGL